MHVLNKVCAWWQTLIISDRDKCDHLELKETGSNKLTEGGKSKLPALWRSFRRGHRLRRTGRGRLNKANNILFFFYIVQNSLWDGTHIQTRDFISFWSRKFLNYKKWWNGERKVFTISKAILILSYDGVDSVLYSSYGNEDSVLFLKILYETGINMTPLAAIPPTNIYPPLIEIFIKIPYRKLLLQPNSKEF